MNWENTFQRLKRTIEVQNGLYCDHLPLFVSEYNTIVNSDNKIVCKKCCDHHASKTFINRKFEKVCALCCQHNYVNVDKKTGIKWCVMCFSNMPQNRCAPISKTMVRWKASILKQQKKQEEKAKKDQNLQTKSELINIAKSLNLKKFWKLNKADLKALINNQQKL